MYIESYWGDSIGGSDDSLTLLAYLSEKGRAELSFGEILTDFGLDLQGDVRQTNPPLVYTNADGWEMDIHCAVDLVMDLAALLLECKVNGSINLLELGEETDLPGGSLRICAAPEEVEAIGAVLTDFTAFPAAYDLSEFMDEDELSELCALCEALRKELCGG